MGRVKKKSAPKPRRNHPASGHADAGQAQRDSAAARSQSTSAAVRDCGPIRLIADPVRRERCRKSFKRFCLTYNPATFYWPFSRDHLAVIRAIESSIVNQSLFAFAMPRGSGKSALCRMAVMWAASYALAPYVFLIGSNEAKAIEHLEAIKGWMRDLPAYVDDFPEISVPAKGLAGIANRASGQLCNGVSTLIRWEATRIVLPRVPPPPNLRCNAKYAPTSGVVIGVSGLTGEGIRGSLFAHPDGRQVRPSFVLLDDPQTDESAGSPTQNATRERLISGAILGMAGPGKGISAVMPCTVIRRDDLVDRLLDRKRNPLWRGRRTALLASMPTNAVAWEGYSEIYNECMGRDEPDLAAANRYYRKHRAELDAGAAAPWAQRKMSGEVSAIQHAMNLLCKVGRQAFMAEYQNEPLEEHPAETNQPVIRKASLPGRLNNIARGVVPLGCTTVTAYVDVHQEILYWLLTAWGPDFTGYVIDYGTYPKQPTRYFSQKSPPVVLSSLHAGASVPAVIQGGLGVVVPYLFQRELKDEAGELHRVAKLFVDAKWETVAVKAFCRRSQFGHALFPAQGFYLRPNVGWKSFFAKKPGGQTGHCWRIPPIEDGGRYVLLDSDVLKSLVCERLTVAPGDPGALTIFGRDPREHELLFDHLVAEFTEWRQIGDTGKWHWELKPGRPDNHWLDCLAGNFGAALQHGLCIPGLEPTKSRRAPGERKTLAQLAGKT